MDQKVDMQRKNGGTTREQLLGLLLAGMLAIPTLEQLQEELYLSKL